MPDRPTMSTARSFPEIIEALVRFEWWERHKAECKRDRLPDERDLLELLPQCIAKAQAKVRKTADVMPVNGPDCEQTTVELEAGVCVILEMHRCWKELPEPRRPPHPFAPVVAAWLDRARPPGQPHVIVPSHAGERPLVRSPAMLDLASFSEIEAIEVDAEPLVTRTATIHALRERTYRSRREPVQVELIPGPRTLAGEDVGDILLRTLSHFKLTGDERNPIRGDIYRLGLATFAVSGAMIIQPREGAIFVGGRNTEANRTRWWAASKCLHGLKISVNERTGEWRNLAVVDVDESGTVRVAPPAWWRGNDRWRLAGGLFRPVLLGEEDRRGTALGYWGGLARTIASFEAVLGYSPTAGRGRQGRIPDLLRPKSGRTGPGPWHYVSWIDTLRLSGEKVNRDAGRGSSEEKRWQRRRANFESAGYVAPDYGEAGAGDTIEVRPERASRKHKAGLMVRASARMVEAAARAQDKRGWTRLPAKKLFSVGDD